MWFPLICTSETSKFSFALSSPPQQKKKTKKKKNGTVNTWSAHQVTPQPRSGRSGACVPSHADKAGRCGRGLAFPPPMGRCAAARCGRRACATTRLPVQGNTGSRVQVRLLPPSTVCFRFIFSLRDFVRWINPTETTWIWRQWDVQPSLCSLLE